MLRKSFGFHYPECLCLIIFEVVLDDIHDCSIILHHKAFRNLISVAYDSKSEDLSIIYYM